VTYPYVRCGDGAGDSHLVASITDWVNTKRHVFECFIYDTGVNFYFDGVWLGDADHGLPTGDLDWQVLIADAGVGSGAEITRLTLADLHAQEAL
jgi:hypothetical protein